MKNCGRKFGATFVHNLGKNAPDAFENYYQSMTLKSLSGLKFTKAHGTMNDFLLFFDPEGKHHLTPAQITALCSRHGGIGADGLIRVTQTSYVQEPLSEDVKAVKWFMDYRNADGSFAQLCGNGVRVFVHFLRIKGYEDISEGDIVSVGTRDGVRKVRYNQGNSYTVTMGRVALPGGVDAKRDGADVVVQLPGLAGELPGLRVDVSNPHTVVEVPDEEVLRSVAFSNKPPEYAPETMSVTIDPEPKSGTNVEVIVVDPKNHVIKMRVLERGVGETYSCGSGCCAAARAASLWHGEDIKKWTLDLRGGKVEVELGKDVLLTGPAEIVADVQF